MVLEISVVIFLYVLILFLVSLLLRNNTVADMGWGAGIVLISLVSLLQGGQPDFSKIVMNLLVIFWGIRLTWYMILRSSGKAEDFRYMEYREKWKFFTLRSYLQIYLLQGVVMMILTLPVWYVNYSSTTRLDFFDIIGFLVFCAGFYFEVKSDMEMASFRKNPENKDKLMTSGLWSLTRHPNYFGESLIWWGITFFALDYPFGWLMLLCPLMMTLILRYVTGVPLMEKRLEGRSGWKEYTENTPVFFPHLNFKKG